MMPKRNRPFRKYKIEVTVLVEGEIPSDMGLAEIVSHQDYVVDYEVDSDPITGKMMADALSEARSDPGFFGLDGDGNNEEGDDD